MRVACFLLLMVLSTTTVRAAEYKLGFKALADMIPRVVGIPLEDEHHNPLNGDALQRTSKGLMVWRKADNQTLFTNGHMSWVNGPLGLQSRLNSERFDWEAEPPAATPTPAPIPTPVPSPTPVPPPTINAPAELLPAWTLLVNLPKNGPFFRESTPKTNVTIRIGSSDNWGTFIHNSNTIVIKDAVLNESVRVVSAVLAHELVHAIQLQATPQLGCYEREVAAYMREAGVWQESGGYLRDPMTPLVYSLNGATSVALTEGEGGVLKRLDTSTTYMTQCR
jgi:hypothetical protein